MGHEGLSGCVPWDHKISPLAFGLAKSSADRVGAAHRKGSEVTVLRSKSESETLRPRRVAFDIQQHHLSPVVSASAPCGSHGATMPLSLRVLRT